MPISHRIALALLLTVVVVPGCGDPPRVVAPATEEVRLTGTTHCGPAGGEFVSILASRDSTPTAIPPTGAFDRIKLPVSRAQLGNQTFVIGNTLSSAFAERCLANGVCTSAESGSVTTRATSTEGPFDVSLRIRWDVRDSLVAAATVAWRPQLLLCI